VAHKNDCLNEVICESPQNPDIYGGVGEQEREITTDW